MPLGTALISPDAELLARSSADPAAFEALVERHHAAVFRFARSLAEDEASAEDVLQETFLAAWRRASELRPEGSALPWLLTVARHAAYRRHRRRRGEPESFVPLTELGPIAGWRGPRDDFVARLEQRELVHRALGQLSSEDREILALRDLEGISGDETATLLGLTTSAMKSRLHRARLRFMAAVRGGPDAS